MANRKICFLIDSLDKAAGSERVCVEIANNLARYGFVVSIICMYSGKPFFGLDSGVNLFAVHLEKKKTKLVIPLTLYRLRQRLLTIKPDVLINVDSALFIYSGLASVGLKIKNLVWEHFNFNATNNSLIRVISRKLAMRYSDAIVTLTEADKEIWQNVKHSNAPVVAIHNPSPQVEQLIDASSNAPIVLAVGRLSHQKGFDRLISAWQIVKSKDISDWKLRIVGSGELEHELEEQIATLGLSNAVELVPPTLALHKHYLEASIYCLSSRYEGLPMVLLEAQAFGLPIISFDCETGPAEIVKHNETGLLVKEGDINSLAHALLYLMDDEDKRRVMSRQAIKHAEKFGIDKVIKNWQHLLSTV